MPTVESPVRRHRNQRIKHSLEIAKALGITRQHLWQVVNGYRESKRTLAAYHSMVKIIEKTKTNGKNMTFIMRNPKKRTITRNRHNKTQVEFEIQRLNREAQATPATPATPPASPAPASSKPA